MIYLTRSNVKHNLHDVATLQIVTQKHTHIQANQNYTLDVNEGGSN